MKVVTIKGVGRKISREGGNGKIPKIAKKYGKIAPLSLFQGATEKITEK